MFIFVMVIAALLGRGARSADDETVVRVIVAAEPIPAEADVFRTDPSELAVAPSSVPARTARPRTLASTRALRAYPGAPPRIPHELTNEEFLTTACSNCHARGGFAERFGAYTPLTPHPEYENCLQCHVSAMTTATFVGSEWRSATWPEIGRSAMDGSPLWIPHDLQMRSNCLACHGGPGAVAEVRTTHPERANCRQCHVPAESGSADDVFTRPLDGAGVRAGAP